MQTDYSDVRSEIDNKMLFRFLAERLRIEIVVRRYAKETGAYHPKEWIDLTTHIPEPLRTRIEMALQGTVDLYAYYPREIAEKMHACHQVCLAEE